jgi:hypothetical protein
MGWTAQVRFLAVQDFSLLHSIQTVSGAHPTPYSMGTVGSFPVGIMEAEERRKFPTNQNEAI